MKYVNPSYAVGDLIKHYREKIDHLNQTEFAKKYNTTQRGVSQIENNNNDIFTVGLSLPGWLLSNSRLMEYLKERLTERIIKHYDSLEESEGVAQDSTTVQPAQYTSPIIKDYQMIKENDTHMFRINSKDQWERMDKKTMEIEIRIKGVWVADATL